VVKGKATEIYKSFVTPARRKQGSGIRGTSPASIQHVLYESRHWHQISTSDSGHHSAGHSQKQRCSYDPIPPSVGRWSSV